jgi:hypothetical protein
MKNCAETFLNYVCSGALCNLVGIVGDPPGCLSCHYALSSICSEAHGNSMASMLTAQHLVPHACHDVISRHRSATDHSFMYPWHHTRKWACLGLAIYEVESHNITSVPHLPIQNTTRVTTRWLVSGDAEIGQGRSSLGERRLESLHRFLSTSRNPARMESALAASCYQQTARAAFLHADAANSTSWCCSASQQLHAHAARPDAIIYPMGP